jgi:hypothetical protein
VADDPLEFSRCLGLASSSLENVTGHIPDPEVVRAGRLGLGRKPSKERERLVVAAEVRKGGSPDDRRFCPNLVGNSSTQNLLDERDGLLWRSERAVRVRDQMILVDSTGHPSIRLELGQGLPVAFILVMSDPKDLTDRARTRGQSLCLRRGLYGGFRPISRESTHRFFEQFDGFIGAPSAGRGPDIVHHVTRKGTMDARTPDDGPLPSRPMTSATWASAHEKRG